jgi:anti-sigma-K factor RskA
MSADMHDLVAPYALDALDASERAAFEAHLAGCGQCRRDLAELREGAAALGAAEWSPPPQRLRAAVLDAVGGVAQEPPVAPVVPLRASWFRRVAVPAIAVAALAAVVALSVQVVRLNARIDSSVETILASVDARVVSLEGTEGVTARFVYSPGEGRGVFIADGLAELPPDRTYQLWLIDDGGPASAGIFGTADGVVTFDVEGDVAAAAAVGLTAEPAGGSPAPTGDILLLGDLSG